MIDPRDKKTLVELDIARLMEEIPFPRPEQLQDTLEDQREWYTRTGFIKAMTLALGTFNPEKLQSLPKEQIKLLNHMRQEFSEAYNKSCCNLSDLINSTTHPQESLSYTETLKRLFALAEHIHRMKDLWEYEAMTMLFNAYAGATHRDGYERNAEHMKVPQEKVALWQQRSLEVTVQVGQMIMPLIDVPSHLLEARKAPPHRAEPPHKQP